MAMIDLLTIDAKIYPFGFYARTVNSGDNDKFNKPLRGKFYHMFWVKSGQVEMIVDNNAVTVCKNECVFIGVNQVFSISTSKSFEMLLVCFNEGFYKRNDMDERFLESCTFFNLNDTWKYTLPKQLEPIVEYYHQSLTALCTQPYDELGYYFAHNTIERLLLFAQKGLIENASGPVIVFDKSDRDIANHFRQLVKENCRQVKQVTYYAERLNVPIKRLTEICNAVLGLPPKKVITEQLVIEAKRLLQHSSMSIKEIGFDLMFLEPSNFIRFFIKAEGVSPSEYRNRFRKQKELLV